MLAEPFESFTFSPAGAAVYQLGQFGTAAKKLHEIDSLTLAAAMPRIEPLRRLLPQLRQSWATQENLMKDLLTVIAFNVVMIIQIMALLVVTFGTIQAFVHSLRAMVSPSATGQQFP